MLQDLRHALRTLGHAPGFTAIVIVTLALGIGANTAIFTLLDQVVLRRLAVPRARALYQLDGPGPFMGRTEIGRGFSFPMYRDLRDTPGAVSALVARGPASVAFRVGDDSERVLAELVSGNLFDALGAQPALGRLLSPADDVAPGAHPVVVLGGEFWRRRFNADPGVIGRSVVVNATPMTIVGVARPGFHGVLANAEPAIYVPLAMKAEMQPTAPPLTDRRFRWLNVVAVLSPDVPLDTARAALDVRYKQANAGELVSEPRFAEASESFRERFAAKTLAWHDASRGLSDVRESLGTPVLVLMGLVGVVLLIACANVANLMLTRATSRQREMSIRAALGASRARLMRQALAESLVVAAAGGAAGALLAVWLGDALLTVLPVDSTDVSLATTPDLRVAVFTLTASALTVVLFGLVPARRSAAVDVHTTLKEEATAAGGGIQHARLRRSLVVAQVALSTLLVAGAGLFVRSLMNLQSLGPGFTTDDVLAFTVDPSLTGRAQTSIAQFFAQLESELSVLPGVTAVSLSDQPLLTGNVSQRTVRVQGYETRQGEDMNPWTLEVGAGFFDTLGIPVLQGRAFGERDASGAPPVAIVNETFARYYFGDENPIGRRFGFSAQDDPARMEIVGVAKDVAYSQVRPGEAGPDDDGFRVALHGVPRIVYTPYRQSELLAQVTFYVRTRGEAAAGLAARIREVVAGADRALPVYQLTTLAATVDDSLSVERMLAWLSLLFGGLATLLAAVGLYGVMSYTVVRRTREIGIRMALGAARGTVLAMVLREVAWLVGLGILVGLPGAYLLGRAASALLYGLTPLDPLSLVSATLLLIGIGLLAGYLPARRAARIEPMLALRAE